MLFYILSGNGLHFFLDDKREKIHPNLLRKGKFKRERVQKVREAPNIPIIFEFQISNFHQDPNNI